MKSHSTTKADQPFQCICYSVHANTQLLRLASSLHYVLYRYCISYLAGQGTNEPNLPKIQISKEMWESRANWELWELLYIASQGWNTCGFIADHIHRHSFLLLIHVCWRVNELKSTACVQEDKPSQCTETWPWKLHYKVNLESPMIMWYSKNSWLTRW